MRDMNRSSHLLPVVAILLLLPGNLHADQRPNILFCISDDQSWEHTGIAGDPIVKTPHFDRVAREGVYFPFAFCSSPSCTPSRAAILTGQDFWRLEAGANLMGHLPSKFPVYPDLLEQAGYYVGYSGKGWAPGNFEAGGRSRNPASTKFKNFGEFLEGWDGERPFCFWYGSSDPHRAYVKGSGAASGKNPADVKVPDFLPDVDEVRHDILDYFVEIERFDRNVGEHLTLLEQRRCLDETIVVVTSDNGFPFPRGKTNVYDHGVRMPLAMRWGAFAQTGRTLDDFVTLTDMAPTFLEAAGVEIPQQMTGRSLLSVLKSTATGRIDPERDRAFFGRERHGWNRDPNIGYPARAVRTESFLYIRNFDPQGWPGFDTDRSPSKDYLIEHQKQEAVVPFYRLWFGQRGPEELYDLRADPGQINNVVNQPEYAADRQRLSRALQAYLEKTKDPRATGNGEMFNQYPYYADPTGNSKWYKEFLESR